MTLAKIYRLLILMLICLSFQTAVLAQGSNGGNSGAGNLGAGNQADGGKNDPNPGTAFDIRKNYFLRFPVAREFGPVQVGGHDLIKKGESIGPGVVHHRNPTNGGPVQVWPAFVPDAVSKVPTKRDEGITDDLFQTFGYPVSDTQFQIIQRYNDNRFLEQLYDPEKLMWLSNSVGNLQATSAANSAAALERNQATTAIDNVNPNKKGFMQNFTADGNNVWNKIRDRLFVPMAILLMLPGAVLTQVKAIVAQGTSVLGEVNPWEGITRSIVCVFLIPSTYLVVNYGIDVNNSIALTISQEYSRIFGSDMYKDAQCAQKRAFPIRKPEDNDNAMVTANQIPDGQGKTPFAENEKLNFDVRSEPCDAATGGGQSQDGSGQEQQGKSKGSDEGTSNDQAAGRAAVNGANFCLTGTFNVLTAFQTAYMLYLFCMGPIAAALWVWPMKKLRDAFGGWCAGVVTLSFWSLFWNTTILLMACFKGVDDTGTIIMSALNWLAVASVQMAFDFEKLVSAAGSQAAGAAQKAMSGVGGSKGAGAAGGAHGGAPAGARGSGHGVGAHPAAAPTGSGLAHGGGQTHAAALTGSHGSGPHGAGKGGLADGMTGTHPAGTASGHSGGSGPGNTHPPSAPRHGMGPTPGNWDAPPTTGSHGGTADNASHAMPPSSDPHGSPAAGATDAGTQHTAGPVSDPAHAHAASISGPHPAPDGHPATAGKESPAHTGDKHSGAPIPDNVKADPHGGTLAHEGTHTGGPPSLVDDGKGSPKDQMGPPPTATDPATLAGVNNPAGVPAGTGVNNAAGIDGTVSASGMTAPPSGPAAATPIDPSLVAGLNVPLPGPGAGLQLTAGMDGIPVNANGFFGAAAGQIDPTSVVPITGAINSGITLDSNTGAQLIPQFDAAHHMAYMTVGPNGPPIIQDNSGNVFRYDTQTGMGVGASVQGQVTAYDPHSQHYFSGHVSGAGGAHIEHVAHGGNTSAPAVHALDAAQHPSTTVSTSHIDAPIHPGSAAHHTAAGSTHEAHLPSAPVHVATTGATHEAMHYQASTTSSYVAPVAHDIQHTGSMPAHTAPTPHETYQTGLTSSPVTVSPQDTHNAGSSSGPAASAHYETNYPTATSSGAPPSAHYDASYPAGSSSGPAPSAHYDASYPAGSSSGAPPASSGPAYSGTHDSHYAGPPASSLSYGHTQEMSYPLQSASSMPPSSNYVPPASSSPPTSPGEYYAPSSSYTSAQPLPVQSEAPPPPPPQQTWSAPVHYSAPPVPHQVETWASTAANMAHNVQSAVNSHGHVEQHSASGADQHSSSGSHGGDPNAPPSSGSALNKALGAAGVPKKISSSLQSNMSALQNFARKKKKDEPQGPPPA